MKPIALREADFKREIWLYKFPEAIKQEFFEYWSEPNKSGTKMRFELEKTWHLSRRLTRWMNNSKTPVNKTPVPQTKTNPVTDIDRLDAFIDQYRRHPSDIPFTQFGLWYGWMKERKLLKPLYQSEIDELRRVYNNDNEKCRCAVVQKTLDGYCNNNIKVSDLLKLREAL